MHFYFSGKYVVYIFCLSLKYLLTLITDKWRWICRSSLCAVTYSLPLLVSFIPHINHVPRLDLDRYRATFVQIYNTIFFIHNKFQNYFILNVTYFFSTYFQLLSSVSSPTPLESMLKYFYLLILIVSSTQPTPYSGNGDHLNELWLTHIKRFGCSLPDTLPFRIISITFSTAHQIIILTLLPILKALISIPW